MGDALAAIGRRLGLSQEDIEAMEQMRSKAPAEPLCFDSEEFFSDQPTPGNMNGNGSL